MLSLGDTLGKLHHIMPQTDYEASNIDFYPMLWDEQSVTQANFDTVQRNAPALMGFNEPNFVAQANMEPADAAALWPTLEQLASDNNIPTLVSPAVNFSPDNWQPIEWLRAFFAARPGCRVDAIAMHSYSCDVTYLDQQIRLNYEFVLPTRLTEFACAELVQQDNMIT
jgi:hypothetical protein